MPNVKEKEEQRKIPVTVVMSTSVEDEIKDMCENLGAMVIHHDIQDMTQAHDIALRNAKRKGLVYIDSNNHPNMIIGQATLGLEILEDMPDVDAVILPTTVDGCRLTAGLAMAIKGCDSEIAVIEVRTSFPDPFTENIRKRTNLLNELEVPVTKHVWCSHGQHLPDCWIDRFITVGPKLIEEAIVLLRTENISDFSAAIGLAGILSGELDELKGKKVVVPVFGNVGWILDQRIDNPNLESCAGSSNA